MRPPRKPRADAKRLFLGKAVVDISLIDSALTAWRGEGSSAIAHSLKAGDARLDDGGRYANVRLAAVVEDSTPPKNENSRSSKFLRKPCRYSIFDGSGVALPPHVRFQVVCMVVVDGSIRSPPHLPYGFPKCSWIISNVPIASERIMSLCIGPSRCLWFCLFSSHSTIFWLRHRRIMSLFSQS